MYKVTSRVISTLLAVSASGKGTIIAEAVLSDITDPGAPVLIDEHGSMRITLDDSGSPGAMADTIGITVRDADGRLWFSSYWDGAKTVDQTIAAGNMKVR